MKRPAGRKKDPEAAGKTEQLNVRVSPETRRMLEDAADESGVSLSREIERRLASSFSDKRGEQAVTPETIELLSAFKNVIIRAEGGIGARWHRDTFTCRAVAEAAAKLLSEFEPEGDGAPPLTFPTYVPSEMPDLRKSIAEAYAKAGFGTVVALQYLELLGQDAPADESRRSEFNKTFPAERSTGAQLLRKQLRRPQHSVIFQPPRYDPNAFLDPDDPRREPEPGGEQQ